MNHKTKNILIGTLCLIIGALFRTLSAETIFTPLPAPLQTQSFRHVLINDISSDILITASNHTLYQTYNKGKTWQELFSVKNEDDSLVFIAASPDTRTLIVGTHTVLYRYTTSKQWETILELSEPDQKITSGSLNPFNPTEILLGTSHGLYRYLNNQWQSFPSDLGHTCIAAVYHHPNIPDKAIASTSRGIYTMNLTTNTSMNTFPFFGSNETLSHILSVGTTDILAVSYGHTLYISTTAGISWEQLSLPDRSLSRSIVSITAGISHAVLFIAYEKELISYDLTTHKTQSLPLPAHAIHDLTVYDFHATALYIATDKDLLLYEPPASPHSEVFPPSLPLYPDAAQHAYTLFTHEPSIQELQEKAILYANVHNTKTRAWHTRSHLKALVPKLSLGLEQAIGSNVDIDRGGTADQDTFIMGPSDKDTSLNCNLEWNLGDLIWNDDQTAIDYREKYMIELRDTLLHTVTQLYYERRALQIKAFFDPPLTQTEYLELCLSIDKLTAHIDALTGGYFSQKLKGTNTPPLYYKDYSSSE